VVSGEQPMTEHIPT